MNEHRTTWRLTKIPEQALFGLKLTVSVDTDAAPVIAGIEEAAERAGIVLIREEK